MMDRIARIEQGWELSFVHPRTRDPVTLIASVPGNIAADLMKTGLLPDLYFGLNPLLGRDWEQTDFTYKTTLAVPLLAAGEKAALSFQGIDTSADVRIEGKSVARSDNMFVPIEIDVSAFSGKKVKLEVLVENIRSTADRNRIRFGTSRDDFHHMGYPEALVIRKAQHSFGWDIAPRLVFGGLWKPVILTVSRLPLIRRDSVFFFTQSVSPGRDKATVRLKGAVSVPPDFDLDSLEVQVDAAGGKKGFSGRQRLLSPDFDFTIDVQSPSLWWPLGYGKPDLYSLTVRLKKADEVLDELSFSSGIRTVAFEQRSDVGNPENNRFSLMVNGERIFCRGSNWVPVDALHRPLKDEMLRTLDLFTDSHCNMIRIWGGGVYEEDSLFEYCDSHGLMIWQDFMFGCAYYPQSDEFLSEVRREAEVVVRRYRNHPALVLWAGDNETDASFLWHEIAELLPSHNKLNRQILPAVVSEIDPSRPYLPSSPFLPDEAVRLKTDTVVAEQHLWGPRGYYKAPFYSETAAVFASEIGYHGCPQKESLRQFLSPAKVWGDYNNDEWLLHATEPTGRPDGKVAQRNELMRSQIREVFGSSIDPANMDKFILASQICQAEADKYYIEHFRSRKWKKTGIIWWNMKDMWPQFSDAVVDYFRRKKLAFDFIRRSQRPVCLMIREDDDGLVLVAVNDTMSAVKGGWSLGDPDSKKKIGKGKLDLPPNSAVDLGRFDAPPDMRLWFVEWEEGGDPLVNHYVTGPAPWDFERYRTFLWTIQSRTGERSDAVSQI